MDIKFIPCDNHEQIPALNMDVDDKGVVHFTCYSCEIRNESLMVTGIDSI